MNEALFTPVQIGGMKLKNRIILAPMATMADPDGGFSQVVSDYFTERAKGGTGLIMSGALMVTDQGGVPATGWLGGGLHAARLTHMIDRIHLCGAKFVPEISYGNGRCGGGNPAKPPYSASAVPTLQHPEVLCVEMPVERIHFLTEQAVKAAKQAMSCGADGIGIHAYAGYLLDQFQSSEWNKRTDEYGGSLENRMRFTKETIQAIRKACGPQFAILVKFSVEHHTPEGRQLEEGLEMCRMLQEYGADALIIDSGNFPTHWNRCIPTTYDPEELGVRAADAVKKTVTIPVIGQNKLNDPVKAAAAIADGHCDAVALGHGLLADPEWALKARKGGLIRPCIGCNECFKAVCGGKNFRCSVNPYLSHEKDPFYQIPKASESKKILVIGGGPAGMAAAAAAAKSGHQVDLWEMKDTLGGNLNVAGKPEFKKGTASYRDYLKAQLDRVNITLDRKADLASVQAGGYDHVIYAAGAEAKMLRVKGVEQSHVLPAVDAIISDDRPTGHVAVIGGGLVGVEAALYAAETAAAVTVLEFMPALPMFSTEARNNQLALRQMIAERKVKLETNVNTQEIGTDTLTYLQNGEMHTIPADQVVIAVGNSSRSALADELEAAGISVFRIGDADHPGKIMNCVRDAFTTAIELA